MTNILRTDVAGRVALAWLVMALLFAIGLAPVLLLFVVWSVPFLIVACVTALFMGDGIVDHPRRWTFAAILTPVAVSSLVVGWASLFSLYVSVPAGAIFLTSFRKWPLRAPLHSKFDLA